MRVPFFASFAAVSVLLGMALVAEMTEVFDVVVAWLNWLGPRLIYWPSVLTGDL